MYMLTLNVKRLLNFLKEETRDRDEREISNCMDMVRRGIALLSNTCIQITKIWMPTLVWKLFAHLVFHSYDGMKGLFGGTI